MLEEAESANVVAELRGREKPDEIVLIGAHLDSWDLGQGAHDNAAGCAIVMQAAVLLQRLGLVPRRTIRVVLFTNEENGCAGARAYADAHRAELPRHVAALESDTGAFAPVGFRVQENARALQQTRAIASLLSEIDAVRADNEFSGSDVQPLVKAGVPGLGLSMEINHYFDYHHSEADTLDKVSPADLQRDVAAVAVLAYVIAEMPQRFAGNPAPKPQ
jgi:Zn-dependent M28 family amino/carboxypeptidase